MSNLPPHFWAKVNKTETCWIWTAATDRGYGRFWSDGTAKRAYRLAYLDRHGDIPTGMELDHLCRNRACVNPDHLEPVTRIENVRRSIPHRKPATRAPRPGRRRRGQTFGSVAEALAHAAAQCINGHERTEESTRLKPGGRSVYCVICRRISINDWYRRNRSTEAKAGDAS